MLNRTMWIASEGWLWIPQHFLIGNSSFTMQLVKMRLTRVLHNPGGALWTYKLFGFY